MAAYQLTDSDSDFCLGPTLSLPRATSHSARSLFDLIEFGDIDLEPEYQRDIVWPETKQIGLIDSIFRNFYVPPVIFMVRTSEDGTETRICIDGKQRLTSIYRFMSGLIPYHDPVTSRKLYFKDMPGVHSRTKKEILPTKYQQVFAAKQIVCTEYPELSEEDERDVFKRVQLGMALSANEKLQATASSRATFTRQMIDTKMEVGSPLRSYLKWDLSRGNDFRNVATSIMILERMDERDGELPKTLYAIPHLNKWFDRKDQIPSSLRKKVNTMFDTFTNLVSKPSIRQVFEKVNGRTVKLSPVEFLFSAVLIGRNCDRLDSNKLRDKIKEMREHVRSYHTDIRANSYVWATLVEYIMSLEPDARSSSSKRRAKRKRQAHSDGSTTEDDDDARMVESEDEYLPSHYRAKAKLKTGGAQALPPRSTEKSRKRHNTQAQDGNDEDDAGGIRAWSSLMQGEPAGGTTSPARRKAAIIEDDEVEMVDNNNPQRDIMASSPDRKSTVSARASSSRTVIDVDDLHQENQRLRAELIRQQQQQQQQQHAPFNLLGMGMPQQIGYPGMFGGGPIMGGSNGHGEPVPWGHSGSPSQRSDNIAEPAKVG